MIKSRNYVKKSKSTLFVIIKLANFQMWLFMNFFVEFELIIFNATPPHQSTSGHTVSNWLFSLRESATPVNLSSHFLAESGVAVY